MNFIDEKYCGLISPYLDRYKIISTNPFKANFRCPYCGDSKKSKTKCRGWLLEKQEGIFYHCFNCPAPSSLFEFIKLHNSALANQYYVDLVLDKRRLENEVKKIIPEKSDDSIDPNGVLTKLEKISSLRHNHPAKEYVNSRKIPANQHYRLYYAPKFNAWINSILPNKLSINNDEPRLVIPLLNKEKRLIGVSGRAFSKKSLRYITIMFSEAAKIFGLDKHDSNFKTYVFEGAIDSLFIPNSLAMIGADINLDAIPDISNSVFVHDNEPRNKEIIQRMTKLLDKNCQICIWPDKIKEKDVNDMILKEHYTPDDIKRIIDENTYSGLLAKAKISSWRKVNHE